MKNPKILAAAMVMSLFVLLFTIPVYSQVNQRRRVTLQPATTTKLQNSMIRQLIPSVQTKVITLAGVTALPVKMISTKAWNSYVSNATVYPLKISATDTLFFNNQNDLNFVKTAFMQANITSITKAYLNPVSTFGGRDYDYYYYCNAVNAGYFTVNGLTAKQGATFTVSANSTNTLFTVTRNYGGKAYNEVLSTNILMANHIAKNLGASAAIEYLDKPLTNLGNFYFLLTRTNSTAPVLPTPQPVPVITPLTVKGSKLTDHSGNPVILHGVNTAAYASGYVNDVAAVAAAIKANTKANCVRIIWDSKQAVTAFSMGWPPANVPTLFTLPDLDNLLDAYTTNHLLPILALHDLTDLSDNSVAGFNKYVVPFWTDPAVITILKKYQGNLIINLQNEWGATWAGMTGPTFVSTYASLITKLRAAGISAPIMIDGPDGGANSAFLIANGAALINADPLKNILLSVHTYWSQENGAIVNCPADYVSKIKAIATSGLPFVLGEVSDWCVRGADGQDFESTVPVNFDCPGKSSANKYAINYDAILTEACADGVSFIAWSWYQDGVLVRNIYDQQTGTTQNAKPQAGSWPDDILSSSKVYGLNNPSIVNPFY